MKKEDFKKNNQNEFKNKWHEKRMYGQFVCEMPKEIGKNLEILETVGAKWSQSENWSNDMCCTTSSIKEKLYKE